MQPHPRDTSSSSFFDMDSSEGMAIPSSPALLMRRSLTAFRGVGDGMNITNNSVSPSPSQSKRRSTSSHAAVVHSMISSNLLRNCREVEDMVAQCINTGDKDSFMCKTAHGYLGGCSGN